jgi:hypothetical protein
MYNWFKIFNRTEFLASGRVSRTYTLNLEGIGQKEILATFGNILGITYEGIFLTWTEEGINPFTFGGHAIYVDAANDVYLGIEISED